MTTIAKLLRQVPSIYIDLGFHMHTVVLVGTDHNFQRPVDGPHAEGIAQFRVELRELCLQYHLAGIAEEMSLSALKEYNVTESVAQQVCVSLGLRHQYSDPSSRAERSELGIRQDNDIRAEHIFSNSTQEEIEADVLARGSVPSDKIREQFWLRKVQEFDTWPLLFVCGANHFTSFTALLKASGFTVVEAHPDWEPSRELPPASRLKPHLSNV